MLFTNEVKCMQKDKCCLCASAAVKTKGNDGDERRVSKMPMLRSSEVGLDSLVVLIGRHSKINKCCQDAVKKERLLMAYHFPSCVCDTKVKH